MFEFELLVPSGIRVGEKDFNRGCRIDSFVGRVDLFIACHDVELFHALAQPVLIETEVILCRTDGHEDEKGIELDHADVEDDVHRIGTDLRSRTERGARAVGGDDRDCIAHGDAELGRHASADGDALEIVPIVPSASQSARIEQRQFFNIVERHAAHIGPGGIVGAGDQRLPFHKCHGGNDAIDAFQAIADRLVIVKRLFDGEGGEMAVQPQNFGQKLVAEPVHDAHDDDQRGNTDGDADHCQGRDDGNERVAAACAQVAAGYQPLKT